MFKSQKDPLFCYKNELVTSGLHSSTSTLRYITFERFVEAASAITKAWRGMLQGPK